jgi:hypothetical protein
MLLNVPISLLFHEQLPRIGVVLTVIYILKKKKNRKGLSKVNLFKILNAILATAKKILSLYSLYDN